MPAAAGATARGEACLQVVASGPDVPGDPLYEGMLAMVQEAAESVWVVTPYFIPDDVLLRSLIVKARAGRDVTVIVPRRSDHPITDLARRHHLRELQCAGARVLLHGPGMMHSKALIIDRRVAHGQWAHLGMLIQTVALLLEERGLGCCMQEAWAQFRPQLPQLSGSLGKSKSSSTMP